MTILNSIKSNIAIGTTPNNKESASTANSIISNQSNKVSYSKTILETQTKSKTNDDVIARMHNKIHYGKSTKRGNLNSGSKKMVK